MKNIFKNVFLFFATVLLWSACKKDEHRVIFNGHNSPIVLSANESGPLLLDIANKENPVITFSWNNPDYSFNTGNSSQDVFYTLQVAPAGSNFSGPHLQEAAIPLELSKTLTTGELNAFLMSMELEHNMAHNVEFRLKATLINDLMPVFSNVLSLTITPYLDVKYPVPAKLFITGGATPGGWQCACGEPELLSQQLVQTNAYTFELELSLTANESYLFVPVYGSWAAKYGFTGDGNQNSLLGDDFKPGGNDIKAPTLGGLYKIIVDFKLGKFSLIKL